MLVVFGATAHGIDCYSGQWGEKESLQSKEQESVRYSGVSAEGTRGVWSAGDGSNSSDSGSESSVLALERGGGDALASMDSAEGLVPLPRL